MKHIDLKDDVFIIKKRLDKSKALLFVAGSSIVSALLSSGMFMLAAKTHSQKEELEIRIQAKKAAIKKAEEILPDKKLDDDIAVLEKKLDESRKILTLLGNGEAKQTAVFVNGVLDVLDKNSGKGVSLATLSFSKSGFQIKGETIDHESFSAWKSSLGESGAFSGMPIRSITFDSDTPMHFSLGSTPAGNKGEAK